MFIVKVLSCKKWYRGLPSPATRPLKRGAMRSKDGSLPVLQYGAILYVRRRYSIAYAHAPLRKGYCLFPEMPYNACGKRIYGKFSNAELAIFITFLMTLGH